MVSLCIFFIIKLSCTMNKARSDYFSFIFTSVCSGVGFSCAGAGLRFPDYNERARKLFSFV